ncbi:IclR family transcriptional regulator [Tamaricihabitans halophyticus]|uniref:Glycerol operon regulatory protein n=1 Tax=Tamaricihabitans halophyticus TaxID=1262583 RepID=A0A4R2QAQ1_9PSEU|nr:IclR family transcriptional regulator [Tamaricihabitans halophyticus]TCP43895.1 IclR family transcriptional regulator [Tamaricihabitans halophyticus]
MPRTGKPAVRQIEAVQRAVAVLDALGTDATELGTNEIARRTGVNLSTVSRLLATLADSGLVQHIPSTGRYRLGIRVLQLASAAREQLDVRALARPFLDELTELSGETSTLSLPGQHDVLTVDFAQRDVSVRSVASIGRNSVAHATAVGKVFLAWGGRLPDGELQRYTERTITERAALDREITQVRNRGWAQAVREREAELNGLAVPVLDPAGTLIAIVGVQGPSSRFTLKAMRSIVEPMTERAGQLGSVL